MSNDQTIRPDQLEEHADSGAALLRALANPQRLRLVVELMAGERGVGELEERTGIRQPSLSKELGKLRDAGVVEGRRESTAVFYQLIDARAPGVVAALCGRQLPKDVLRSPSAPRDGGSIFARIVDNPS